MEGFLYYGDLMVQAYLLQDEQTTSEAAQTEEVETSNTSWLARLGNKLAKIHHWFSEPIEAQAEESYQENRLPLLF